jgi:hypothetical protein
MTFSEPVKKGNGGLAIRHGDENYVLDLNSGAVRVTGNRVTVTLPVPLPYQTAVSVTVSPGLLRGQRRQPLRRHHRRHRLELYHLIAAGPRRQRTGPWYGHLAGQKCQERGSPTSAS